MWIAAFHVGFVEANLCAQEIKIKLVDGRNGQSLGNNMRECVGWRGPQRGHSDTD